MTGIPVAKTAGDFPLNGKYVLTKKKQIYGPNQFYSYSSISTRVYSFLIEAFIFKSFAEAWANKTTAEDIVRLEDAHIWEIMNS